MNNEPLRPDPDRLLEQTAAPHRGKLKVFFGACAGVGKTWAMLAEAQRLRAQGLDIVVGVVETHGRKDTAAMLEGILQPWDYAAGMLIAKEAGALTADWEENPLTAKAPSSVLVAGKNVYRPLVNLICEVFKR